MTDFTRLLDADDDLDALADALIHAITNATDDELEADDRALGWDSL